MIETVVKEISRVIRQGLGASIEIYVNDINVLDIVDVKGVRYSDVKITLTDCNGNILGIIRNAKNIYNVDTYGINGIEIYMKA